MTISHDQMLCVHEGKAHVFVPYKPRDCTNCGGGTCVFRYMNECSLEEPDLSCCVPEERADGLSGYWKETDADIT